MTRTSKKTVTAAAEVLNKHLMAGGDKAMLLTDDANGALVLDLVNEILDRAAEGGKLVSAVESNGTLLGFVPRFEIPIPEKKVSVPASPPVATPEQP